MAKILSYPGQAIIYGLIALVLGYFSAAPAYRSFPDEKAQLLLSFAHLGQRKEACRRLTQEEIAEMAANMRRSEICERERLPIFVELEIFGEKLYAEELQPTGLSRDGAAQVYRNFRVEPGAHDITVRLRDSARDEGFDYEHQDRLTFAAGDRIVIDFRDEFGFIFWGRTPLEEGGNGSD